MQASLAAWLAGWVRHMVRRFENQAGRLMLQPERVVPPLFRPCVPTLPYILPASPLFLQDIIQQTPPSLRSKAARLVGAKCTLLARIDAYGQVGGSGRAGCWLWAHTDSFMQCKAMEARRRRAGGKTSARRHTG